MFALTSLKQLITMILVSNYFNRLLDATASREVGVSTSILPFRTRVSICLQHPQASTSLAQMSANVVAAVGVAAASASAVDVDARRHDGVGSGGGGAHAALPDAGWARVLIGCRGRRRRRRRAKGWRNRQAPSRGPAATVSSRRASSQRPAAVSTRRKDGHDGWHGRP